MCDTAGKDIGREDGHSRPPSLSLFSGQPVDMESPTGPQSTQTPSAAGRQSNSFRKKDKKMMNIDNLLDAMDSAHAALVHVVASTTEEHSLRDVPTPGTPGAEDRNAMIRSAADGLSWWVTKMRETNAKVPFVPTSPVRQNSTPRSNAGLHDFVERCDAQKAKSDRRGSDLRRATASVLTDSRRSSRVMSSETTPTMPGNSDQVQQPQHQTADAWSLEEQILALKKERDELKTAHQEEIKQKEHYKALSGTLVDKMTSVLEALKKEHKQKMKKAREQLAYMEVENERYMRLYQAELELHFDYQEACERLQKDVAYLRKKTSGCASQFETSVMACTSSTWAFILWLLSFFTSWFSTPAQPPLPPPSPLSSPLPTRKTERTSQRI